MMLCNVGRKEVHVAVVIFRSLQQSVVGVDHAMNIEFNVTILKLTKY